MNEHEREGLVIEATQKFSERDGYWTIPEEKNQFMFYRVIFKPNRHDCTCGDYQQLKPRWCKHLYALKYRLTKQKALPKAAPKPPAKKSPPRDWSKYNKAQSVEHGEFKEVLHQLCQRLPTRSITSKGGRPPVPLSDLLYSAVSKVRHHKAGRKMASLLEEEQKADRIGQIPRASTILNFFNSVEASDLLQRFIGDCCIPFKLLETEFAIDSTFFPIPRKHRWYDQTSKRVKEKMLTFKAHVSSAIDTNILTAIRVTPDRGEDKATADATQFPFLLDDTAQRFRVVEVLADAAYCTKKNFQFAKQVGAILRTRFSKRDKGLGGGDYTAAWYFQRDRPKEHFERYNLRNNVESTNSMMKREFPGKMLFKSDRAIENEILCIALVHNIDCLIAAKYVHGVDIEFWKRA